MGGQNKQKSIQKCVRNRCFFQHRSFCVFFQIFNDFGLILGGPGRSKNCEKSLKIGLGVRLEHVWTFGTILDAILKRFYLIFYGFGDHFGSILGGFGIDFENLKDF